MRIVADDASQLVLRDRTYWISLVCLAGAVAIGAHVVMAHAPWTDLIPAGLCLLFALAFLRATQVVFDRSRRTCVVRRLDMFRLRRVELAFGEIADVRVEPSPGDDDGPVSCRLALVDTGGAVLPLTAAYEPDLGRFEAMRARVVEALFAGRTAPGETDPVMSLIAAGRRIDAVAFLRRRDGISLSEAHSRVAELSAPGPR